MLTTPKVMGVINVTPDSFYAGSRAGDVDAALRHAATMVAEGADILDIGGEATNPKLDVTVSQVDAATELQRVVPVVQAIRQRFDITISVDTSKPDVMRAAIDAGANMINDQRALQLDGALAAAAELDVPVCLMHMYGLKQRQMDNQPLAEMLTEIKTQLLKRVEACVHAGIRRDNLIIDPGIGTGNYGKSTRENLYLINHLNEFADTGLPVLVGLSRKSMIGEILNVPPAERLYGGLGLAVLAMQRGAGIIRTHDVLPTVHALKMAYTALTIRE